MPRDLSKCDSRNSRGHWWCEKHPRWHPSLWQVTGRRWPASEGSFAALERERPDPQQEQVWVQQRQVRILWVCILEKKGISPDQKKVVNLSTPSTASEVRSRLGMTNYFSRFIPDYATKTEPLRKLTYKDRPWCWTTEHDRSAERSVSLRIRHCLLRSKELIRDLGWCQPSWLNRHSLTSGPVDWGKGCNHLCKSFP